MPNKTIYVAEEDLSLYEEAQALAGGNLSAAIARALRRFVDVERAHRDGFEEITVVVGSHGSRRQKRFFGYRVARWEYPQSESGMMEVFSVYRTKGGRYAVHRRLLPNWAAWADPEWWSDPEAWRGWKQPHPQKGMDVHHSSTFGAWKLRTYGLWKHRGEATLSVFETLDEMRDQIPPELFEILKGEGQEPPMEDLDI